jgi:hypothetical protein
MLEENEIMWDHHYEPNPEKKYYVVSKTSLGKEDSNVETIEVLIWHVFFDRRYAEGYVTFLREYSTLPSTYFKFFMVETTRSESIHYTLQNRFRDEGMVQVKNEPNDMHYFVRFFASDVLRTKPFRKIQYKRGSIAERAISMITNKRYMVLEVDYRSAYSRIRSISAWMFFFDKIKAERFAYYLNEKYKIHKPYIAFYVIPYRSAKELKENYTNKFGQKNIEVEEVNESLLMSNLEKFEELEKRMK